MKNEVLSSLTVTISTIGTREIIVILILLETIYHFIIIAKT